MTELKSCPFCGNEPTIQIIKGKDGWRDRYTILCRYDKGGCGAESGLYHSEIEAVEAWNRRNEGVTNDLISRQAAIDAIWDGINMDIYTKEVKEILEELPTAEPKTGKWIHVGYIENTWRVSKCSICESQTIDAGSFCTNCGARMEKENNEGDNT